MRTYYEILGVSSAATSDEIRRAYRILARRYHPDLNPGDKKAEDTFKTISKAYQALADDLLRRKYDIEIGIAAYKAAESIFKENFQKSTASAKKPSRPTVKTSPKELKSKDFNPIKNLLSKSKTFISKVKIPKLTQKISDRIKQEPVTRSVSVIEVSISVKDAIRGVKKTIELQEPNGTVRKLSVMLPSGIKNGSVIRLQGKNKNKEELVVIARVAPHPFLSIQNRGLVYEVPITFVEAIQGTSFVIPSLDEDLTVKVPAGTSSGDELRVVGHGITYRDGTKGDLFIRFMVVTPNANGAVGLSEISDAIRGYYGQTSVRTKLPRPLFD